MPAPQSLQTFLQQNLSNANFVINNLTQATGSPLSPRDNFFQILEQWESSMILQSMWMVFFKIPGIVTDQTMKRYGEFIVDQGNSIDRAKTGLSKDLFMNTMGCAFCQAVTIPAEQGSVEHAGGAGEGSRGFLAGPVHKGRSQYGALSMEFLETNVSFVDFLIRPWMILGTHRGLIANSQAPITTDMVLVNLARAGVEYPENWHQDPKTDSKKQPPNKRGFVPRKIWIFEKCIPVNISSETYSTDADTSPGRKDTEWYFKRYQVILPGAMDVTAPAINNDQKPLSKGIKSEASPSLQQKQESLQDQNRREHARRVRAMHERHSISMDKNMEKIYKERGAQWTDY